MNQSFYDTLAVDLARVITTGPRAEAMLGALEDPWSDDAGESEAFLHPAFRTPPQRPPNMGDWHQAVRAPFEPWDEILGRVKALEFKTQKELAAAYHKPAKWVTQFKKVAFAQHVMTKAEWESFFPLSKGGNRGEKPTKPTNAPTTNQPEVRSCPERQRRGASATSGLTHVTEKEK